MSSESNASKLPAQASMTRCFLSFATSALVSRYFNARKGQLKRFTLVSMIPGARDDLTTGALREAVCAAIDGWLGSETATALNREFFKKLRRSIGFMSRQNVSMLSNQGSIFIPFLRKMDALILRRFPPKIFIRSALEISASKTLPSSVARSEEH